MATDTTDKVPTSSDVADDIDFNEIAASLGLKSPAPAAEEKKPEEKETTEPDGKAETEDQEPEAGESPEAGEDDDAEQPEETAGEDAEEPEEKAEDEEEPKQDAEAASKVQRRIDKLTAEKHELREQLDAIKAELEAAKAQAEAKPPVVVQDPTNPLSSFTDATELEAQISKAQAVLDYTDDHREGMTVTVDGEEKFYDAEAVKQIRANARNVLKAAPKQQAYLREREQYLPVAKQSYPEFFTAGTPEQQALQAAVKAYPAITQYPNWELIVGDAFVGQRLRLARLEQAQKRASGEQAKKAPAKAAAPAKAPGRPSASPKVSGSSSAALRQKAEAVLKGGGDAEAITDLLEAIV